MPSALLKIYQLLRNLLTATLAVGGAGNILGWTIAIAVPVAYVGLWVSVLTYGFSSLLTWFIGSAPDIFGGSNFPSGAMWLLNQTFPLPLIFGTTVTLLVTRVSAAGLLAVAITASRFLKG
jgi:hypothetical protein